MAIYDCFTFYDELDILEFRLEMLYKYVDYFVLSELPYTYHGEKTEPVFKKNFSRFERYKAKIIYVTSEYSPEYKGYGDWEIEYWHRNCMIKGLSGCKPDDLIMISDVDEIPNPKILRNLDHVYVKPCLSKNFIRKILYILGNYNRSQILNMIHVQRFKDVIQYAPVSFRQRMFYYFLNCEAAKMDWRGTVVSRYDNLCMPEKLRELRGKLPVIENGGWHFSNFGGVQKLKSKLKNSMNDYSVDLIRNAQSIAKDDELIEKCICEGKDIFGRSGKEYHFEFISPDQIGIKNINKKFPEYERYVHYSRQEQRR